MRNKAIFVAGLAAGFIAGTRAGRERYDQMMKLGRRVAGHPAVQKTTQAATAKATDLTKTAAAKAPDLAKTATAQVPRIVSSAKEQAVSRLPFGKGGDPEAPYEEAADSADVQIPPQPDSGSTAPYNGIRAD